MKKWIIQRFEIQRIFYQLGYQDPFRLADNFVNKLFINIAFIFIFFAILSFAFKNMIIILICLFTIFLFVRMKFRYLKQLNIDRKRQIQSALPLLLTNWCVLLSSGSQIQTILQDSNLMKVANGPLEDELLKLAGRLQNGIPILAALHTFSNQCNTTEISRIVYFINLHLKSGENLLKHLIQLNRDLWLQKKFNARKRGEEASAKLLFPMVLQLISVMATLIYPVFELMRGDYI